MIKEALQYIVGLGRPPVVEVEGRPYAGDTMKPIKKGEFSEIKVSTLTGFIDYIHNNPDKIPINDAIVVVESPTAVSLVSQAFGAFYERHTYIKAVANIPTVNFGIFYDSEQFNILLQSNFYQTDERNKLLNFANKVTDMSETSVSDNGISQQVTAKTGIAKVGFVDVPNPVTLAPYRTFTEIEQPSSKFVFRMQSGPKMALFEADGGAWKNTAMQSIAEYIADHFDSCDNNQLCSRISILV